MPPRASALKLGFGGVAQTTWAVPIGRKCKNCLDGSMLLIWLLNFRFHEVSRRTVWTLPTSAESCATCCLYFWPQFYVLFRYPTFHHIEWTMMLMTTSPISQPLPSFTGASLFCSQLFDVALFSSDFKARPVIDSRGSLFFVDHSTQAATNSVPCSENARALSLLLAASCCSFHRSVGSKLTNLDVSCIAMPKRWKY